MEIYDRWKSYRVYIYQMTEPNQAEQYSTAQYTGWCVAANSLFILENIVKLIKRHNRIHTYTHCEYDIRSTFDSQLINFFPQFLLCICARVILCVCVYVYHSVIHPRSFFLKLLICSLSIFPKKAQRKKADQGFIEYWLNGKTNSFPLFSFQKKLFLPFFCFLPPVNLYLTFSLVSCNFYRAMSTPILTSAKNYRSAHLKVEVDK